MNRREFGRRWTLGALLLAAPILHAQQGSKVHMHGGEGYAADGFLWEPSGNGNGGAVLIIHGSKGLTAYVREEAQRLYSHGFVAIAVDLARGQGTGNSATATTAAQADNALHDLKSALIFLRAQPNVRASAIGLEGWDLGGLYALRLAASDDGIRAVAVTLARSPDPTSLTAVHCPLLVNLPRTADGRILLLAKKSGFGIKSYSDADGEFFDPESGTLYRAEDADDARQRIDDFLARELVPNAAAPAAPSDNQGSGRR